MKDCYHNEEYSMVLRMIISEKWIHINSYDVCFDYNVKSVIILKQKIIESEIYMLLIWQVTLLKKIISLFKDQT